MPRRALIVVAERCGLVKVVVPPGLTAYVPDPERVTGRGGSDELLGAVGEVASSVKA